jgi:hypothetical protein
LSSSKPRLVAIRFTKRQLLKLPKAERELLLRVGLALNDLALFQRIWASVIYREPKTPLALEAQAIQGVGTLLVLVGKIHETCKVFRQWFLARPVGREYLRHFSVEHQTSVATLKKLLDSDDLLTTIRNSFAFHYHDDDLSPFVDQLDDDDILSMYLGAPDGNSMNTFASEAMFRSLLTATGEATPKAALDRIQDFAGAVIAALNAWGGAVQIVAVKKMLGNKHGYEECEIADHEFLPQDQICFPFFMSVPERHREQLKQGATEKVGPTSTSN